MQCPTPNADNPHTSTLLSTYPYLQAEMIVLAGKLRKPSLVTAVHSRELLVDDMNSIA